MNTKIEKVENEMPDVCGLVKKKPDYNVKILDIEKTIFHNF